MLGKGLEFHRGRIKVLIQEVYDFELLFADLEYFLAYFFERLLWVVSGHLFLIRLEVSLS